MFAAATSNPALAARSVSLDPNATVAFAPTGVFQSIELETNATTGLANWNRAKRKLAAETAIYKACDNGSSECPPQLRDWRNKLKLWRALSQNAQLIQVNHFGNAAIAYTDDRKVFHALDYWATPAESLKGRGDCEDYVLLKYASLRSLGFAEDQLRIVIVNDLKSGLGHAILSVRINDENYILDNQDNRVLRHDSIARYAPVYSVNAKGRWINIATRDLKRRKVTPVMLVASAAELGEVLPATGKAKVKVAPTSLPRARLQATAAIALLRENIATTQLMSPPPQQIFSFRQRLASLLLPIVNLISQLG